MAGILRHIQGITFKHGEKTAQQAKSLLSNLKEKEKVLLVLGLSFGVLFQRQSYEGLILPVESIP